MSAYRDRLLGFGVRSSKTTHTTVVPNDDGPGVAGLSTEHRDGRVDAAAFAPTVTLKQRAKEAG